VSDAARIDAQLAAARACLAEVSDSPRLDAELLLCAVLKRPRTHLYTWPEQALDADQLARLHTLLDARAAGHPIAHLLGEREFWGLPLQVTPDTLIPRPETELLVEQALLRLPRNKPLKVADLGTGSGAIALAIASERPEAEVHAVDASLEALKVAEANAERLGLGNVHFHLGSWLAPLAGMQFDLIASNPPYIPEADPHLSQGDVRFEPRSALAAGADGLDDIRQIIHAAPAHLAPGGWLLLEHGYDQREALLALLDEQGWVNVADLDDLAGQPRLAIGRRALVQERKPNG